MNRKAMRSLVEKILQNEGVTSPMVVSLFVVGDRKMRQLNRDFHDIDATTDVLSFPYLDPASRVDERAFRQFEEEGIVLGDLVISYPEVVREASKKGILVDEEVELLVEHGMNHLLGKHHD